MADIKATIKLWLTSVDEPDVDEIHDDLRSNLEDWSNDSDSILSFDRAEIYVQEVEYTDE